MELTTFFENVEQHDGLSGQGVDMPEAEKPGVVVKDIASGLSTRLPVAAIEAADWSAIEEVLTCKREPIALQHMTRVVGYYSRVENWNKSKIGELNDRHKGDYALSESAC